MKLKFSANSILLIATRQIGDVLLVTPLLRSIRRAYPNAVIDVLVYENKGGMLEGNPDYNTLISVAEHPNFRQYQTLLKRLFRRYDLAISTLPGDRPLTYALLAAPKRVAIVPSRGGNPQKSNKPSLLKNLSKSNKTGLLNKLGLAWLIDLKPARSALKRFVVHAWTELDNQNTHTVIQNLRLADLLGIERCYRIVIPQTPDYIEVLNQRLPFAWQTQPFAVLHILPMWHYKRWTLTGWLQLIDSLIKVGLRVVLTGGGSPSETAYLKKAMLQMPDAVINLAGQLRFAHITKLISTCQVYIGPDTAVTHLAAAIGTPTVALYGPTNPLKWAPWPHQYALDKTPFKHQGTQQVGNVLLVQGTGDCVPCHQEGCEQHKQSHSRCLEELDSGVVIDAVKTIISK